MDNNTKACVVICVEPNEAARMDENGMICQTPPNHGFLGSAEAMKWPKLLQQIFAEPTMFEQVKACHEQFDLRYDGGPRDLDKDELDFRIKLHSEELTEFKDAVELLCGLLYEGYHKNDSIVLEARQKVFDALLDGMYLSFGTCHRMGFDVEEGFKRVNQANMAKERPQDGTKTKRGTSNFELIKPKDWIEPNLIDLVTCQEWPDNNVNKVRGLITLDGPDCSGKTTLANKFVELYGAEYIHLTWSPELEAVMDKYRISAIEYAIALSSTKLVILDRPWISQVVYAEVFRGGTKWPDLIEHCDQLLQKANALQILCLHPNVEAGLTIFNGSGKAEGEELYGDISETLKAFTAVYEGDINTFNPTSSKYLSELMRSGGFRERVDSSAYMISEWGDNMEGFTKMALSQLNCLQLTREHHAK